MHFEFVDDGPADEVTEEEWLHYFAERRMMANHLRELLAAHPLGYQASIWRDNIAVLEDDRRGAMLLAGITEH